MKVLAGIFCLGGRIINGHMSNLPAAEKPLYGAMEQTEPVIPKHLTESAAAAAKSLQSYPTLCDPMDCSPPGFSIHGILQTEILERVAISFSRGYS